MPVTDGNDINILQGSDAAIIGAGLGDDTYIVSPFTLTAGQEVTVSDPEGTNTLQLIGGLTIASSMVVSNAAQLTLSNGAIINILDADTFNFNVGGNAITGDAGEDKDFSTFAQENLDITVPAEGEAPVAGGQVVIPDGNFVFDIAEGTTNTVGATAETEVFSFDAVSALAMTDNTMIEITGFDPAADSLQLDIATAGGVNTLDQLNGVDGIAVQPNDITGVTTINFGNDADGDVVTLQLVGITDPTTVQIEAI